MAQPAPNRERSRRPSRSTIVALAVGIGLLCIVVISQNAFNLKFLSPATSEQTLIFAALSALIFLVLIALLFVLARNLLKLYAERRVGKLGSKFRTRMVLGALMLSFLPVIFLFLFAYGLMNRSIDKWFSRPVEELREDSGQVAALLSRYASDNARSEAEAIADLPETQQAFANGNFSTIITEFRRRERTLQGGFALALSDQDLVAGFNAPAGWRELRPLLPSLNLLDRQLARPFTMSGQDYIVGEAMVGAHGRILIVMPLPAQFRQTLEQINASERNYYELSLQRKQIRRVYMGWLLLITTIVLFAATWFALFLSKLVTRPVVALAEATEEISRGRFDYRVEIAATDELGALVASFNRMAAELESARRGMQASGRQLASANVELDQRRRHMETILESIPTGVLSLDAEQRVSRANHALARIFSPAPQSVVLDFPVGAPLQDLFAAEVVSDLEAMMRKADRMGSVTHQMEIQVQRTKLNVAVTVSALHHDAQRLGYVVVFDDLSDLLKANKQAAWREVARRIAHEIKNPLTPIALSADRIQKHLERAGSHSPDAESVKVISDCAQSIGNAVETLRSLVDEFSAMARFPASQPQPSEVNAIVQGALAMFNGRLDAIELRTFLATDLPLVMADPNAMKRALANIVDNAAEAVEHSLVREVHISTALLESKDAVEIVVADTGPGVSQELKEKLFFPYFSTKKRGTGLGLAIVGRIVEEHRGSVRVEENSPVGTRFVVELPVAAESQSTQREAHSA